MYDVLDEGIVCAEGLRREVAGAFQECKAALALLYIPGAQKTRESSGNRLGLFGKDVTFVRN